MVTVRNATLADLPAIMTIYHSAQEFMIRSGNPNQWGRRYPTEQLIADEIRRGVCYVITNETGPHGVFCVCFGEEPTYAKIEDGAWPDDAPYIAIHRVAGDGTLHGIVKTAVEHCLGFCNVLRIDTHPDNLPMQRSVAACGFVRCGVIRVADGSPRYAYQLNAVRTQTPPAEDYQQRNARTIDRWVQEGWEWGVPITHAEYESAQAGRWDVKLTPIKAVPHSWFGNLQGKRVLGLASGGGQQMPVFAALGAECTVLDYSDEQLKSEQTVAQREGYAIEIVKADMTRPLPFADDCFDLIFHPVSNCYVEQVKPIWRECFRVLKPGGVLLAGLDNGVNYLFDGEDETRVVNALPFHPLHNADHMRQLERDDCGIQFSHTLEEQIGGQLEAGFQLTALYEDTNGEGRLHELNIPCFVATRAVKPNGGETLD